MKEIKLTKECVVLVDDEDFEFLSRWHWYANIFKKHHIYACRDTKEHGVRKRIFMHKLLANAVPGQIVDHINGDTLDNRKNNLRPCTKEQNNRNRAMRIKNNSGYKGVSLLSGKWTAQIATNKKVIYLGRYESAIEAALVYNEAAIKYHGEFARLNNLAGLKLETGVERPR